MNIKLVIVVILGIALCAKAGNSVSLDECKRVDALMDQFVSSNTFNTSSQIVDNIGAIRPAAAIMAPGTINRMPETHLKWFLSPGHHMNIRNPDYSVVGVGRHGKDWTPLSWRNK